MTDILTTAAQQDLSENGHTLQPLAEKATSAELVNVWTRFHIASGEIDAFLDTARLFLD